MFRAGTEPLSQTVGDGFGQTAHRDRTEFLSVVCLKAAVGNAAQCHGLIQHRLEYRSEIAGRGIDDLQHLGSRGLLLQGFARLRQQPRVLDRDDRLVCERRDQGDLFFGKRLDSQAGKGDDAGDLIFPQERHP